MFTLYPPKSGIYSTTMNMITCIILYIYFHISRYEEISTYIYIHLGVHISESLSLYLHRMDIRIQYERV